MRSVDFSQRDLAQMEERGITPEALLSQLRLFREGISPLLLESPATLGNGIRRIERDSEPLYLKAFHEAASGGRFSKFVPASGAATRMFQVPLRWLHEGIPDESGDPQLRLFSSAIGEVLPFTRSWRAISERGTSAFPLWNRPEGSSLLLTGEGSPWQRVQGSPSLSSLQRRPQNPSGGAHGRGLPPCYRWQRKARLHLTLSESSVDQAKELARERLPLHRTGFTLK